MIARNRARRRRRQDKPATPARLLLDHHVKSDTGFFSADLLAELFPRLPPSSDEKIYHIAIAPFTPNATPTETSWSIVPVQRDTSLPNATVKFSPSSTTLQSFALYLQEVAPSKLSSHSRNGIEIAILDVLPLPLSTVFVSLESELTKRLENGEGTFYRDRPAKGKGIGGGNTPQERLTTALRIALAGLKIVHSGDLFPLPLPPHPVTHVPPNPGKIVLCEPVAQGVLTENTKVVLMRGRGHKEPRGKSSLSSQTLNGVREEDEDTANDQFFSAAEDRYKTDAPAEETESITETETEASGLEQDDDMSDDSLDDMIGLEAPTLPPTASGMSTMQPGTPMTIGRGRNANGASTTGSVYSSYTATTARPDRPRGRLFKVQGLLSPVEPDLLYPKPSNEDDEEARIFVDIASLPRIGCFSGDWVRIEAAEEPPVNGFGAFGLGSLAQLDTEESNWRPVRVYGLPQGYIHRPVSRIPHSRKDGRSASFFDSHIRKPSSPAAYASPILLANLDSASYLRISPLKRGPYQGKGTLPKFTSAARPPYARDISIQHVQSQLSVERAYQTAVLGGLKRYFARKVRLVRTGDLVAVPIDAGLGKAMQDLPGNVNEGQVDDVMWLMSQVKTYATNASQTDSVAWFRIGHIQVQKPENDDGSFEDMWGSVACFDSSSVGMQVSGSEKSRIPGTKDSSRIPIPPEHDQKHVSSVRRQLRELLTVATSTRAIGLKMPPMAILLTSSHRNIGKKTTVIDSCADVGLHAYLIDANDILTEPEGGGMDQKIQGYLKARSDRAMLCGSDCCALMIRHLESLTAESTADTLSEILQDTRVLVATTNEVDKLSDAVRGLFTHELEIHAPDEAERGAILRTILDSRGVNIDPTMELNSVALKTAALVAGDLVDVVDRALIARQRRLEKICSDIPASSNEPPFTIQDVQISGGTSATCLTKSDFDTAVEAARRNFADSIGAPKIPNVQWDDVGGMAHVKSAITESIQLPLERPELFAKGLRKRSGILFYGPPGTGKTLLAKAIATEYSLNFFSVKGPELLNMYVGESEANVRRVFQRARDARPCVVFFDELDSVAPKRGNQGDSGGVMDRIVSQLLAELDGMAGGGDDESGSSTGSGGVFVIGATNRPDLLDPALLRPGRFDKMIYLGVADAHDKQVKILEALTRKFALHPFVSLTSIASRLPLTYTGADFYALCSDAMLKAVTRQASSVDAKIRAINADRETEEKPNLSTAAFFDHYATEDDVNVLVTEADFTAAQRELVPSVSRGELEHYETVRKNFEGPEEKAKERVGGLVRSSTEEYVGSGKSVEREKGGSKGKGKGKGKASHGFQESRGSDDDGLY